MNDGGLWSDCEDEDGGQTSPPTLPAAPATPRSPRLAGNDPHALATQFFGVSVTRSLLNPFKAQVKFNGKPLYLGVFREVEDAARAHDAVVRLIPGRQLNFPSGGAQRRDGDKAASDAAVRAAVGAVRGKNAAAAAAAAAASDDGRGRIDERPPARRKRPCSPTATLPPLTRADLLVLVRVRLRAARVDDSAVDLENVSESGLRAMLDDIQTRLSLR